MNEKTIENLLRDFLGILVIAFTLFSLLALLTYSPADPSFNRVFSGKAEIANSGGLIGAYLSDALAQFFGCGALIFPLVTFFLGWTLIRGRRFNNLPTVLVAGLVFLAASCGWISLGFGVDPVFGKVVPAGGVIGSTLHQSLVPWLNATGATLVFATFVASALLAMTRISINTLIDGTGWGVKTGLQMSGQGAKKVSHRLGIWIKESHRARAEAKMLQKKMFPREPVIVSHETAPSSKARSKKSRQSIEPKPVENPMEEEDFVAEEDFIFHPVPGDYQIPPHSILDDVPEEIDSDTIKDEILESSKILENKLADFGILGRVVQVRPGPVITLYEYEPAPGIKVSRILALSDDLALAMRALSLRILAPVPGKPVVGIEIPNAQRQTIYFKEVIDSEEFSKSKSKLTLAIGKDHVGQPMAQDLAVIPHILMAGSTGSGKSVGLNAMICSLLLNASPEEVKMIMVDPKMLELSIYDGIPHLIAPVVTNPKKAAAALQWAVAEMEMRYRLMAERGVRNIGLYNKLAEKLHKEYEDALEKREKEMKRRRKSAAKKTDEAAENLEEELLPEPPAKLPYIVVFIDELADLMMVSSKGVEDSLARLAQMARAAGIHLIVATQRPSVDVLTGVIKANFPSRISYKVISRVDSRTILDAMGADKLLGKGDMLFLPPGTSRLERIHGVMVSDAEIRRIVDFVKRQKKPDYLEDIFQSAATDDNVMDEEEEFDEKYDEAVALIAKERQASISFVQRRLRVGYNRAARMIETMEKEGVVGPSDGIRPREVYVKPILFEE